MKALTILWLAGLIWGVSLVLPEVNDVLNAPLALALALLLAAALASYLATGWVSRFAGRYASRRPLYTPAGEHPTRPLAVTISCQSEATPARRAARRLRA